MLRAPNNTGPSWSRRRKLAKARRVRRAEARRTPSNAGERRVSADQRREVLLGALSLQQVPAIVLDNLYRKGVNFIDASQVDSALLFVFVEDVDAAPVTVRMRNNFVSE